MDITIKRLHPDDTALLNDIRLLAAERGCRMVSSFEFGKYEQEQAYTILINGLPTYFTHSHRLDIENVSYYRVASKAAQLDKHLTIMKPGTIPGRYKSGEMYLCGHYQGYHANGLPCVLTATIHKDDDSPDSHKVFHHCAKGHMYSVDPNYKIFTIHKKQQAMFTIDRAKALYAFNEISKYNNITYID